MMMMIQNGKRVSFEQKREREKAVMCYSVIVVVNTQQTTCH